MKASQWTVLGLLVCLFVLHLVCVSAQAGSAGKNEKARESAEEPGTAAPVGQQSEEKKDKDKGSAKENVEVDTEKVKANKIASLKKLIEMYKKSEREGGQPSSMLRSLEKQLRNLEAGPGAASGDAAAVGGGKNPTDFNEQAEKMVAFRDIIRKDAQRVREETVGPEDDDNGAISSDPSIESDDAIKARVAQGTQKLEEFKALPGVQEKNGIYFRRISEETEGKFATSKDRVHITVKATSMSGEVIYDSKQDTIVSKPVTMNRLRTRLFKLYELATFVREGETLEAVLPPDVAGTVKRIPKSNFYAMIPSQSTVLVELTVNKVSTYKRDEL